MQIKVYPLLFNEQGGMFIPRNPQLHQMAVDFAKHEMGMSVEQCTQMFTASARVFVAVADESEVVGLSSMRMVTDVENLRFLNAKAAKKLIDRMHDWLADQGVPYGTEVFVRIPSEGDPHICPKHKEWLQTEHAVPAGRWVLPTR